MAVMPFTAPETITGQTYDLRGWWFGSHDVRQSRNVASWTAESLARQLATVPGVEIVPPYDLRRYLLEKRRVLMKAHPDLTEDQIDVLLRDVPLSDFGRDLEVDKIITGQIFAARLSHNRTVDTWASTVDYQIQVWDIEDLEAGGVPAEAQRPEYEDRVLEREWFGSWLTAADAVGREIADRMKRGYFSKPAHFSRL
jgi:hypothetical protein